MSNPLQQTIEALAKEKGIEPDVVISAIEEAVATASRKYYKTGENLKTRFNTETGQVDLFALKSVVEEVTNAATEVSIDEARAVHPLPEGNAIAVNAEDPPSLRRTIEVINERIFGPQDLRLILRRS